MTGLWLLRTPSSLPAAETDRRRRAPVKRGVLLRIVDAVAASNRRKAECEIAKFIARNGGTITDRVERGFDRFSF